MQKLKDMIPIKLNGGNSSSAASSSATTANKTAQPQILGRLKMGHRVIQLKKKIGQGGYAIVYLATDENTYKTYVLKRMDCKVSYLFFPFIFRLKKWKRSWIMSSRFSVLLRIILMLLRFMLFRRERLSVVGKLVN